MPNYGAFSSSNRGDKQGKDMGKDPSHKGQGDGGKSGDKWLEKKGQPTGRDNVMRKDERNNQMRGAEFAEFMRQGPARPDVMGQWGK